MAFTGVSEASAIEYRVRGLVADLTHKEPGAIATDANWRALGLDSLDLLNLLLACEQAFGVEIPDMQAVNFNCIQDFVRFLSAK